MYDTKGKEIPVADLTQGLTVFALIRCGARLKLFFKCDDVCSTPARSRRPSPPPLTCAGTLDDLSGEQKGFAHKQSSTCSSHLWNRRLLVLTGTHRLPPAAGSRPRTSMLSDLLSMPPAPVSL